jgi:hypothetical protein
MRGGEIPGAGPILARFCLEPGLSRDNHPNSGSYGPLGDHSHDITNVREDGGIPQHEPRSWQQLNTFRTQAQSEGGTACQPPVPG